ncbi:MAG: amidohydrolase family protein, partial [Alphaproteobacteria bacterium]|nr:amidohydrolase family protein [Alphaproteobacteria bacterium]
AVSMPMLQEMAKGLKSNNSEAVIHIHIAEQTKEVQDCLQAHSMRPVEFLYDNIEVDKNWCLVHATHLNDNEISMIAKSKAVAGICPTTEANLGDGLFPLTSFSKMGGVIGIGSDSHVSRSPIEELRLLEYGQRLTKQERAVYASIEDGTGGSVGRKLWQDAAMGGAQALGLKSGEIKVGNRFDVLTLNSDHPNLYGLSGNKIIDALIFNGNDNLVKDVFVAGQKAICNGVHPNEDTIKTNFLSTLKKLQNI